MINYKEKSRLLWDALELEDFPGNKVPIYKYLVFQGQNELNEFKRDDVARFEAALVDLNLELRVNWIKEGLIKKYGEIPPAGYLRGNYFKKIHLDLHGTNNRLINLILSLRSFDKEMLIKLFEGDALIDMEKALGNLELEMHWDD